MRSKGFEVLSVMLAVTFGLSGCLGAGRSPMAGVKENLDDGQGFGRRCCPIDNTKENPKDQGRGACHMSQAAEKPAPQVPPVEKPFRWVDIRDFGVEGRGFEQTESFYDRLPTSAKGVVADGVWTASLQSAGMCVRFVSDAPNIAVRWTLKNPELALTHMPASSASGLDLYGRVDGVWHFVGLVRPQKFPDNEAMIARSVIPVAREYKLNLPLHNGVAAVSIGVAGDYSLEKAPSYPEAKRKAIVFYGTSIMHGIGLSRPGMTYPAILGRRLDWPVVNLGFSGSAKAEIEMARLLAQLDPAAYVLDPIPNLDNPELIHERIGVFVRTLREAHPRTPIILVEHFTYPAAPFVAWMRDLVPATRQALGEVYQELKASGMQDLYLVGGEALYGADGEATVDGTHSSDLGAMRFADAFEPLLRVLLK
jgi:lysophospholipase L1-like esterase